MNDWQQIILSLRKIAEVQGVSQQEIANRTGLKRENVNLLFSLKRAPTLRTLCKVADALGAVIKADHSALETKID